MFKYAILLSAIGIVAVGSWSKLPLSVKGKIGFVVGPVVGLFYFVLLRLANIDKNTATVTRDQAKELGVTLKKPVKLTNVARVPIPNMKGITTGHHIFTEYGTIPVQHLTHELVHVEQIERNGFFGQMCLYGQEQALVGYNKNKYENEARSRSGQQTR